MEYIDVYDLSELPAAPAGMKYMDFIGGEKDIRCFLVPEDTPRNEFFRDNWGSLDEALHPIYHKDGIVIHQDASFALPGFYIVAYDNSVPSFDMVDEVTHLRTFFLIRKIREGMRQALGIPYIHFHYEEKPKKSASVHYWMMPVDVEGKVPGIFKLDILPYLEKFKFSQEKERILRYNDKMRAYVADIGLAALDDALTERLKR